MGTNKTVFASRAERSNHRKLESQWGDRYNVWHNLPFLNVFTRENLINPDFNDLRALIIPDTDWQRLKRTSIDYVLCDKKQDAPLICIDFDGLQNGFNFGREYLAGVEEPSPWRHQIMTLKLLVAHGSLFPYFVVGSSHFAEISDSVRRSIVDGLIGVVLAKKAFSDRIARGFTAADFGLSEEDWDAMPPWELSDLVEEQFVSMEIDADFEHNPIYGDVARLWGELGFPRGSHRFVDCPGAKRSPAGRLLEEGPLIGAEHTVHTSDVGSITRTAWLPNFDVPGFAGLGLVEEIAHLMALDEVRKRRQRLQRQR
jgi:hypothetical protein